MMGLSGGFVLAQQALAARSPASWWDGVVTSSDGGRIGVTLMTGERMIVESPVDPRVAEILAVNLFLGVIVVEGACYPARIIDPRGIAPASRHPRRPVPRLT